MRRPRIGPLMVALPLPIPRAMTARTRANRRRGMSTVLLGLGAWLLACLLLITGGSAHAAGTDAATLRSWTDAQLAAAVKRHEVEATRIGELLLASDGERSDIVRTRDAARDLLAQHLADTYRRSVAAGGSGISDLLASRSLTEVADRVHVAQVISRHHGSIIGSLDRAERSLEVSAVERAQLVVKLAAAQRELVGLSGEQGRRAQIRAKHEADRAAKARAAKERAADKAAAERAAAAALPVAAAGGVAPSALVAAAPAGTVPLVPSGPVSAQIIDGYLASKGSPMTGQGAAFMASGQRYQVDPRLLVAIAGAESNFGAITCGPHNAWGWACPNDPADFATWAMGIDTVTRGLRRYYLDEGRTSVSLIQQKYCPVGAANDPTGLNVHWTVNVTKFLVELGGNPNVVGPGPSAAIAPMFPGL